MIDHRSNISFIKELSKIEKVKILPFVPVKYAYKDAKNDEIFKDILLFANILGVRVIPVKRFRHSGLISGNKIYLNVKSGYPLFYVFGHEISHLLERGNKDYVYLMADIIPEHFIDGNADKIYEYFKYFYKVIDFKFNTDELNLMEILFELTGDIVGEMWMEDTFWELFKIGVENESVVKLADIGIRITKKEKGVIDKWNSVKGLFNNWNKMMCDIVDVVRDGIERCIIK